MKIIHNLMTIFSAGGLESYILARKIVYNTVNSYLLHCPVKLTLLMPQNNINEVILVH